MFIAGQRELLKNIDYLIENDRFPRFSIIVGRSGSGKKLICDYISNKLGCLFVPCGVKADEVREIVDMSYTLPERTLYMFADSENMSVISKNIMLKVTEEPPQKAYFIMTVEDLSGTLSTLTSRGSVFRMNPYNQTDLVDFIKYKKYDIDDRTMSVMLSVCTTPNEIMLAVNSDFTSMYSLVEKFAKLIGTANLANELKVGTQLSVKSDDGKYDTVSFLRLFMVACYEFSKDGDVLVYNRLISITSRYLNELSRKGANKQSIIDCWIIDCHIAVSGGELC